MSRGAFQINYIYNLLTEDTPATINTTASEVDRLERNYTIVSETAHKLKKLPSGVLPGFKTAQFDRLVADLRIVLSLVRCELGISDGKTESPNTALELPASFARGTYNCLCPLTVLLQAVATSLSKLNIEARQENMGSTSSLLSLIKGMEERLIETNGTGDFCAGLAHAIMIHEKNSQYTVVGSAPRYKRLKGLQWFATDTRNRYLEALKSELPEAALARIREVETVSKDISEAAKRGNPPTQPPAGYEKVRIEGTNITVTAKGDYKPACLTDYLRLSISTPPAATKAEAKLPVSARTAQNFKACAEFLMVCFLFRNPDPDRRPSMGKPIPGHKKADSWPKDDNATGASEQQQQQQGQQGAAGASAAPKNLPQQLGTPQPGRGRAPSPPENTKTQKDKTTTLTDRTKPKVVNADQKRKVSGNAPPSAGDPRGSGH